MDQRARRYKHVQYLLIKTIQRYESGELPWQTVPIQLLTKKDYDQLMGPQIQIIKGSKTHDNNLIKVPNQMQFTLNARHRAHEGG